MLPMVTYYSDVTWHLKSLADWLFNLFRLTTMETSKLHLTNHIWGESSGDRWISLTKSQYCENISMLSYLFYMIEFFIIPNYFPAINSILLLSTMQWSLWNLCAWSSGAQLPGRKDQYLITVIACTLEGTVCWVWFVSGLWWRLAVSKMDDFHNRKMLLTFLSLKK